MSEWKVETNNVYGFKQYAVYRLRNKETTDHSGNREYIATVITDKEEAQIIANKLNQEEDNNREL